MSTSEWDSTFFALTDVPTHRKCADILQNVEGNFGCSTPATSHPHIAIVYIHGLNLNISEGLHNKFHLCNKIRRHFRIENMKTRSVWKAWSYSEVWGCSVPPEHILSFLEEKNWKYYKRIINWLRGPSRNSMSAKKKWRTLKRILEILKGT